MKKITLLSLLLLVLVQTIFSQITLLKNINPGSESSLAMERGAMAQVGNTLFFAAVTDQNGAELWKTDGTSAGTVLVKDINPGSTGSNPDHFYALGDKLVFTANDGAIGRELWVTDGTEAGTTLLADVRPGTSSAFSTFFLTLDQTDFFVFQNELYFRAFTDSDGLELYKTDGTAAGTVLLKNISPGLNDGCQGDFTELNGELYFVGFTATHGGEIWKTDGTTAGTVQVTTNLIDTPTDLTAIGNLLIFVEDDGISGPELWKSDGTDAGTGLLKDTDTAAGSGGLSHDLNIPERRFFVSGAKAYFSVIDINYESQVWVTDGTGSGTIKLISIGPLGCAPANFVQKGNLVLFTSCDFEDKLWRTTGTVSSTLAIETYGPDVFAAGGFPNSRLLHVHDGMVWYGAEYGIQKVLYQSNGVPMNATRVEAAPFEFYEEPQRFFSFSNQMIFWAQTSASGSGNLEPYIYRAPLTVTGTTTSVSCHDGSDGAISVQASGTAPFMALWQPFTVSGLNPSGLSAGVYSVTVTDATGSQGTQTFTIQEPGAISLTLESTPATGTDLNGTATVSASGGTPPYQYLWNTSPSQTGPTATGLAGTTTYTCSVTDANGCTSTGDILVDFMVGTEHAVLEYGISLAPNPATQWVKVTWKNQVVADNKTYRLFDASGKLVGSFKNPEYDQISLEGQPGGLYVLEILLDQVSCGKLRFVKN